MTDGARPSTGAPARLPALQLLQAPAFRRFWYASMTFYLSRWIEVVVLGWLVLELTNSPFLVALTGAVRWFPMLAFGSFLGVVSDRFDRKRLVQIDQMGCITVTAGMLLLMVTGRLALWHILAASFLVGLFSANDMTARRALLADIAGEDRLVGALTLDSMSMNVSAIAGGAAGGALLALFQPSGAYLVMLGVYLSGFVALWLAAVPRNGPRAYRGSPLTNLREGARYAATSPLILATLAVTVGMNLLVFPYKQLLPVFARDVLGAGPEGLGLLAAGDGLGALCGAICLASMAYVRWKGMVYLAGSLVMGSALFLFSFSHVFPLSLLLLVLLGTGMSGFQTMQPGIIMLATPLELRGRMIGILTVAIGCFPLGMLLLGAAASVIGPLQAVRIMGAAQAVLVVATMVSVPALRRF